MTGKAQKHEYKVNEHMTPSQETDWTGSKTRL